jgi:hypothetical protein
MSYSVTVLLNTSDIILNSILIVNPKWGATGRKYEAYVPITQTSSLTNIVLLVLYLGHVHLQYINIT